MKKAISLSRMDKILLTMSSLTKRNNKTMKFEDLVVALFKKFPNDFQLRGYKKYPDSELVNNALYHNLKLKGVVNYGNKTFSLTQKGLDHVKKLKHVIEGKKIHSVIKLERYVEKEIRRIVGLDSFHSFIKGNKIDILDTDFFSYIGTTVRTDKKDFLSRYKLINEVIRKYKNTGNPNSKQIVDFHKFMLKKFRKEIEYKVRS